MHKEGTSEYFLQLERDVLQELKDNPEKYRQYLSLNEEWRQRFLDFCTGLRTMPLTYDPFFNKFFHPDVHPERLSRFISSLIDKDVKVIQMLPIEDNIFKNDTLLMMDILVELEDSSFANVKIEKIPCSFPVERMSCHSSDLLLREYSRVKDEGGRIFNYNNVKKVYSIIFFEKSIKIFHVHDNKCVHIGKTTFNTGLELELLQEYCLIALDVFKKERYLKDNSERTAWLQFLTTETIEDAVELASKNLWLVEIYKEIEAYMENPLEVLDMYSEALEILEQNTEKYMIEEQQIQLAEKQMQIKEQQIKINEQNRVLEEKEKEVAQLRKLLMELQ